jgi:hypothetical protein
MAHPSTKHGFQLGIKQDKTFHQNSKGDKYTNTWNQPYTQINHTRFVFNDEHDVPKNWNKRALFGKMQSLHNVLEEYLSIYHAKALAHQYGEHHETNNVDLELKKHVLEFTMEQLSGDRLTQHVQTMQHPGKWHGTIFAVVLHLYDQIKLYMWLKLIGHLPSILSVCYKRSLKM